jgi:hypothetical protein
MMHWQKLAVAGIAAIGAAMIATPAPAASGLQSHAYKLLSEADTRPEVTPINHRRNWRRNRWDDDFDGGVRFGFGFGAPFFAFGGYPGYGYGGYPYRYSYSDYDYDDSYLHCHGKRYWRNGKRRCAGRWHRH